LDIAKGFEVFDVENKQIVKSETVANPGHRPGFLPNFLADLGVNVIISGGMGNPGAVEIFNQRNIEVVIGAKGKCRGKRRKRICKAPFESSGSVCREHQHP
jgi:predicted Fe-Mo cluster-binding NifX family protein